MIKKFNRSMALLLCLALVAGFIPGFPASTPPVSAATASYDDYNDVSFIYNLGDCPSMQGMAIHGNYIYCAKVNTETETSAIITRTNKNTGESTYMVDTGTGSNFFSYLAHANDLAAGSVGGVSTLFVAASEPGSYSLVRFAIDGNNLTKVGNYTAMYDGAEVSFAGVQIMHVDDDYVTLLIKRGRSFYTGKLGINQTSGTIELTYHFTTNISDVTINGTSHDLTDWLQQGFGYFDHRVYVPMAGGDLAMDTSCIIVYDIEGASGTIKNDPSVSIWIQSSTYAAFFEIESCGIDPQNGRLYFNTNRRLSSSDTNYDGVHYVAGFTYQPESRTTDVNDYRWEMTDDQLLSVTDGGATYNPLIMNEGSVANGTVTNGRWVTAKTVVLEHDNPWILEWKSTGKGGNTLLLSSKMLGNYAGNMYLYRRSGSGLLALGYHDGSQYNNYGLLLSDHGVDGSAAHVYRLTNKIASDGSNMVYLSVDGKELGAMNQYYVGATAQGTTSNWISGQDFKFSYIGSSAHRVNNVELEYIQVWGNGLKSMYDEPNTFRWETKNNTMTAISQPGYTANTATALWGSCTDGVYSDYQAELAQEVRLLHDQPWSIEWGCDSWSGSSLLLASHHRSMNLNTPYLYRSNSIISLGNYDGTEYANYGIKLSDHGISNATPHVYRMTNKPNVDGSNMVYLYVDGVELGPMNNLFYGSTAQGITSDWISGKDFTFTHMGTYQHKINTDLNYMQIWEAGNPAQDSPDNYRWESGTSVFTNITDGYTKNNATSISGSVSSGAMTSAYFNLDQNVVLRHDREWSVQWESEGTWKDKQNGAMIFCSTQNGSTNNALYLYRRSGSNIIALGYRGNGTHNNYGVNLSDHGIDGTAKHTYLLTNRINADGSNMVYLSVDGVELGAMNNYYAGATDQNTTDNWVSGKDFSFGYIGTENFVLGNCKLSYLQVSEGQLPTGTVEFRDWDGSLISSAVYTYGETVTAPAAPTRPSDATYNYFFAGWDKPVVACNGDAVYTATYTTEKIPYTIQFVDWDGTLLSSGTYCYGDTVTAPADPTRSADDTYTYAFAGWDSAVTTCDGSKVYTATYTATRILKPTLTLSSASLSFEAEVMYNIYFTGTDLNGISLEDIGLITWNNAIDGTIEDAHAIIPGAVYSAETGEYMVRSQGIAAKNLGDILYFKVYARLSDGSYIYSRMSGYSGKIYAENRLQNSTSTYTRALCVALLNYGAAAQEYFGYKSYNLMNSGLTEEQLALVQPYDQSMLAQLTAADSSKTGNFVSADGAFSNFSVSVSFDGSFAINYYFIPGNAVEGEMVLYWWDAATYATIGQFTTENATGSVVMTPGTEYWGAVSNIAAKEMDQAIYVAGVYTSGGVTYTTNIITYSLGRYFQNTAANNASAMQDLAMASAVYGYYAKEYFANV